MTAPLYNLTDTWNDGATVFTALKMSVTNTGSAAGSKVMDLLAGSAGTSSVFSVDAAQGRIDINAAQLSFGSHCVITTGGGFVLSATGNNSLDFAVSSDGNAGNLYAVKSACAAPIGWASVGGASNWGDLFLWRDAAGILAQRNGVNAQASRLFEAFTDAANNSMLRFDAGKTTTGVHRIMSEANGTGTLRNIAIDGFSKSGAPTSTQLPAGTWGVFKDSGGGGVVVAYNDGGTIKTAGLT